MSFTAYLYTTREQEHVLLLLVRATVPTNSARRASRQGCWVMLDSRKTGFSIHGIGIDGEREGIG